MAYRTTTILHPHYGRTAGGRILQPHERPDVQLSDYLTVLAIETYGVWSVQDMLPKLNDGGKYAGATLSELANYVNKLETEGWR